MARISLSSIDGQSCFAARNTFLRLSGTAVAYGSLVRDRDVRYPGHVDKKRAFRIFTIVLLLVSVWTAYANVFADDTEVLAHARELVNKEAGCGDRCRLTSMKGERGMIHKRIEYDIDGKGHFVATCRRKFVIAGDYACEITKA
jgi:hypothetical protein